jgi:hypothetical protein
VRYTSHTLRNTAVLPHSWSQPQTCTSWRHIPFAIACDFTSGWYTKLNRNASSIVGRVRPRWRSRYSTRYELDTPTIELRWHQIRTEAHPASCTVGTGSFSGIKRPRRGGDHPLPSWEWVAAIPPPALCTCISISWVFLRAVAILRKATISFVMSICPSAWNNSAPTGRILMKLDVWGFFKNLSRKLKFH